MNAPHFAMYAQGGMLASLDDAIGDSEVASKADFPESLVDMYSDNGVCMVRHAEGLRYHRCILQQRAV